MNSRISQVCLLGCFSSAVSPIQAANFAVVPEPSTHATGIAGLLGLTVVLRRHRALRG